MNYEFEFKFKIDISIWKKIESKLPQDKEVNITNEVDMYYDNEEAFKLAFQDKAIRIRKTVVKEENTKKSPTIELTYKGPKINKNSKTRKEINLVVNDLEGFESLFRELNLKPIMSVNKLRTTNIFKIENEILLKLSFDQVKDFGTYIELEAFTDKLDSIPFIEEKLIEYWHKLLKISNVISETPRISIRESYLELIKKKEN